MSKAKMMMPGKAGGCWEEGLAIWQFPQLGVPTPRCQHEEKKKKENEMDGGQETRERQAKRVETDLEGDKQKD